MIYVFRLSKISGSSHEFTIGKEIIFSSMRIRQIVLDDPHGPSSALVADMAVRVLDLGDGVTIIDQPTTFSASQTVTFAIKEIAGDGLTVSAANANTAFGVDVLTDGGGALDRGINIWCEFDLIKDEHHYSGNAVIANSI